MFDAAMQLAASSHHLWQDSHIIGNIPTKYVARPFQLMFYSSFLLHHFVTVSCTCTVNCLLIPCCSHNSMNFEYVYYLCLTWVIWSSFLCGFLLLLFKLDKHYWLISHEVHPKLSWIVINKNHELLHVMLPLLDPEYMYEYSQKSLVLSVAILKCTLFCFSKNTIPILYK